MQNPVKKMDLKKEQNDLKFYFFTVQNGLLQISWPEDFKAVMAYNDEDAFNTIRKDYPVNMRLGIRKRGQMPISQIVDALNLPANDSNALQVKVETPSLPDKEKTIQEFVYGMLLIADKFVENEKDKVVLKRIVNRIKIGDKI